MLSGHVIDTKAPRSNNLYSYQPRAKTLADMKISVCVKALGRYDHRRCIRLIVLTLLGFLCLREPG